MTDHHQPRVVQSGRMTPYEYYKVHYWVKKQLGNPRLCDACGVTDWKTYDWANLSGDYKYDLSDWKRMCRPCHFRMDRAKTVCDYGHPLVEGNIYVRPNTRKECLICISRTMRKHYKKYSTLIPKDVAGVDKKYAEAVRLRKEGRTLAYIAEKLGYSDTGGANYLLKHYSRRKKS